MKLGNATRRTDPVSSLLAEMGFTMSGKRATHARLVWALVKQYPKSTAGELAAYSHGVLDSVQITRRLNDLRKDGWVRTAGMRVCRAHKNMMMVWETTKGDDE